MTIGEAARTAAVGLLLLASCKESVGPDANDATLPADGPRGADGASTEDGAIADAALDGATAPVDATLGADASGTPVPDAIVVGPVPDAPTTSPLPDAMIVVPIADATPPPPMPDGMIVVPIADATPPPPMPDAFVPPPPPDAAPTSVTVCAVGGTYTTISAAVAGAVSGSTIEVCPGTYVERVAIAGKALHLRGTGGAVVTILDGASGGPTVTVSAASTVTLEGFTIQHGNGGLGGGVSCDGSILTVSASILRDNDSDGGGGLYADSCQLTIADSTLSGNSGGTRGGGAWVVDSNGEAIRSHFLGNQAGEGGGFAIQGGTFQARQNEVTGNTGAVRGGGTWSQGGGALLDNQITDNDAGWTGGGMYVADQPITISGNTVADNISENDGGGIYIHQAAVTINNNTIRGNYGGDDGGGLRIFTSAAHVENNLIEDNEAGDSGGGIRISHLPSIFVGNTVRNNTAAGTGGGMDMDNDSSQVYGGLFEGNHASRGGGIYGWLFPWLGARIEGVTFRANRASRGGAIALENNFQAAVLRDLLLEGNIADRGGGFYTRGANITASGLTIVGNTAYDSGGALWVGQTPTWFGECPCPPDPGRVRLSFLTMFDNTSPGGSVLWSDAGDLAVSSSIAFANEHTGVVLGPPEPVEAPDTYDTPGWSYNDVSPASFSHMADPTGGNGNISADPLFVNAAAGDFTLGAGSLCRDAGDPALADPDGTRADMGSLGGP